MRLNAQLIAGILYKKNYKLSNICPTLISASSSFAITHTTAEEAKYSIFFDTIQRANLLADADRAFTQSLRQYIRYEFIGQRNAQHNLLA